MRVLLKIGLGTILSVTVMSSSFAEEIYKSVGKGGVIEYSTIPPDPGKTVETLTIPPEPSEADIRAAQQRLKEIRDELEQREQVRAETDEPETDEGASGGSTKTPPNRNPFPALAPFLKVAKVRN